MRPLLDPALAALLRALRGTLADGFVLVEADSTPWASMTFEGARHRVVLRLPDRAAALRLAAALPEMEFHLHGHLVAEVAEIVVDEEELRFSALTVVDA